MAADVMSAACPNCGSRWLDARYDYAAVAPLWRAEAFGRREHSFWRYAELLPLDTPDPEISLREGYTPLIRLYQYERIFDHPHLYIKDERQGPTSSFKDRQAALTVTALKRAGIDEIALASTGNAAAAYAAYCARAGIKLWLFLTSLVPSEKMREAALYGAEVVKVSGTYDETKHVAAEFAKHRGIHFDQGAKGIPGKESMKTLAFEIAEQLGLERDGGGWHCPDWYVQAVSGGIGPLGVWKGFSELRQMGLIDRMPRLAIVQAAGCSPMVQAFAAGKDTADPVAPKTLITVLATGDPGYSYHLLHEAVLSNNGTMIAIEDGETFVAMRRIASKAGLSVEPATAVAFAGLEKLLTEGLIGAGESVVVNCSGHTFPAESHVLGDQYLLSLELGAREEGLGAALHRLDEQITTVLVVDDNANDRRLIRRLLRAQKNYRILEATNGVEALQLAQDNLPNLIVTDLTMPEMDGFSLLERLKHDPTTATIPVVVVSAKSLSADDKALLEPLSQSIWTKGGFSTRQLVDSIVNTLGDAPVQRQSAPGEEPRTVVIIDDNPHDLRLARRMIESSGQFRIIESQHGRDGLKAIYEHHPDLVILDLSLPDMDGLTVLETIQNDPALRESAIIVYSARQLSSQEQQRISLMIPKADFDRKRFISTVQKALLN
ncbi:MAG: pyridoxal-phosphate dependent enzyme [Chloroflexi bacterium]|nr:pyridoxal-phosphate dependent enzyme [Chloroflexota bacterium]